MPATLTLRGVDELLAALEHLAPALAAAAGPLAQANAQATATALRAAVPVVTGTLRNSIQVDPGDGRTTLARVTVGAAYAPLVEFGTRYVPARPAFVPLTRRGREAFVKAVVDRVREEGLTVTGG